MKRDLAVIFGCIFGAALVSPVLVRVQKSQKPAEKIVFVPSVETGIDYEKGNGPEEAVYKSVKNHPSATQFKIVWSDLVFSNSVKGAAVYNRAKKTVRVYDAVSGNGMVERSHNIFFNVDDTTLKHLAAHPLYVNPDSVSNEPISFFEQLKNLGCRKQILVNYKHYYPSYYH